MNSQEYRNLQEAYLDVYQQEEVKQLDELSVGKMLAYVKKGEKNRADLNKKWDKGTASYKEKMRVLGREEGEARASDKVEKKTGKRPYEMNTLDKARYAVTKEEVDIFDTILEYLVAEATAMVKRGLDEPAIRQQIASKTGGGSFADKAGKLADRETYGNKGMKAGRENLARKQRGDFRDTTSSDPGLRGYGHKATTDADKAKQSARGAQRSALTPNEKKQLNREELSLDERVLGQDPEMRRARTKGDKRLPPSSGKEYAANQKKSISYMDKLTKNNKIIPGMAHEEVEEFDEATAMAKRGYDEAFKPLPTEKLDNKIKKLAVSSDSDSGRRQGNIGRVRSNIGKSQKTQSFGSTESQKRKSAKHHAKSYLRQNRHSTQDTKDKPDLYTRAVGYYIDRGEDAKKKHLQRMNKESYDLYDIILSHLINEGYADTNENALVIMANMSEDWKQSIVNEGKSSRPRYPAGRGVLDQETRDEKREASAENMRGHTEGPGTVTKNPKKLRKQKSMGELGS